MVLMAVYGVGKRFMDNRAIGNGLLPCVLFSPPGGNKPGREPWRSALALCWELGVNWLTAPVDTSLLFQAWQRGLNCPSTTAVGRLFDAAAALTGVLTTASFEGQGPMLLEAIATEDTDFIELPLEKKCAGFMANGLGTLGALSTRAKYCFGTTRSWFSPEHGAWFTSSSATDTS
jgi:hypothetical protein